MGMAVGAEYGVPHGVAIAAALPAVMRYNAPSCPDRYREIADLLGAEVEGWATARPPAPPSRPSRP